MVELAQRNRDLIEPPSTRTAPWRSVLAGLALLVVAGMMLHATDPEKIAWIQNFMLVFSALLIEAFPFILLGALVSAAIEVFVPQSAFARLARIPGRWQVPTAALAGMAFPVCECGSVPVARRLAAKGLAPGAAITFMLAAPVANPIVIASTYVAYHGRSTLWLMVFGRLILGLIVAMCVGWVVSLQTKKQLLKPRPDDIADASETAELATTDMAALQQIAEMEKANAHVHASGGLGRWRDYFGHVGNDFLFMGRFLILGAAVAAGVQTFIPQSIIGSVANLPIISLLAMMGLAFILSLCSESDAFVAASFVQFGPAPQLAFLVFGPMVDMKLGAIYMGTYNRGFFRTVLIVVTAVTLVGTLWIQVIWG